MKLLDELRTVVHNDLFDIAILSKHARRTKGLFVCKGRGQTDDVHQTSLDDSNALQVVKIAIC